MSISAGTYTFGATGTYSGLLAALTDVAAALTGDLVLNIVGASNEAGGALFKTISLGGFRLTVQDLVPNFGNPTLALPCDFASLAITLSSAGSITLENLFCRPTAVHDWSWSGVGGGVCSNVIKNNLFFSTVSGVIAFSCSVLYPTAGSTETQVVGNKFLSLNARGGWFSNAGAGANSIRVKWWYENNSFYRKGNGSPTTKPAFYVDSGKDALNPVDTCIVQNNLIMLEFPGTVFGVTLGAAPAAATFAHNARNGSADALTWAFSGMADGVDITSLDPTNSGFLNDIGVTLPVSGGVPAASQNPYTVAPYPIGLYVAPPPPPAPVGSLWMPAFVGGV